MKKFFFILFLLAGIINISAQEQVRIMSYNLLRYPYNAGSAREVSFKKVIDAVDPDILGFCEMSTTAGVQLFLDNVLGDKYKDGTFRDNPLSDIDNGIYYKDSLFTEIGFEYYPTEQYSRDIPAYTLVHNITSDTLIVYVVHLKAGDTDEDRRLREINQLRLRTDLLKPDANYAVMGDFNVYTSDEPAYQKLLDQSTEGCFVDPINRAGNWHNNFGFADIHTQSTRTGSTPNNDGGSTGGLDDRFDFLLVSQAMMDAGGITYIPDSYHAFGQDGEHFNKSINDSPYEISNLSMLNALYLASDHLPVYADFEFETITSAVVDELSVPDEYYLLQNYPNPFNPVTRISFSIPDRQSIELSVFDVLGRKVAILGAGVYSAGRHSVEFDGSNFTSGIYLYRLETEHSVLYKKMVLLR